MKKKYTVKHKYGKGLWPEDAKGNTLTLAVMDGDKVIDSGLEVQKAFAVAGCEYAIDVMCLKGLVEMTSMINDDYNLDASVDEKVEELNLHVKSKINFALKNRKITQNQLAEMLGCSKGNISRKLNGNASFSTKTIAEVFHAAGYTVRLNLIDTAREKNYE